MGSVSTAGMQSSYRESLATSMESMVNKGCDVLYKAFKVIEKTSKVIKIIVEHLGLFFSIYYNLEITEGLIAIGLPVLPAAALGLGVIFIFFDHVIKKNDFF